MELESLNRSSPSEKSLEQQANFKGNWSEVLFDRMQNPVIKKQLIDLYYQENILGGKARHMMTAFYSGAEATPYIPPTREQIEKWFDDVLAQEMVETPVDFSKETPTNVCIPINYVNPLTGEPLTIQQKSLAEAHEKGHNLRKFDKPFFEERFAKGFDRTKVILDNKSDFYYLFSAPELAERMAQLKNYFGMRGSSQFTREHLEYARKHYLEDMNFDNLMTQFFQAITPQTEEEFLKLINNSGI